MNQSTSVPKQDIEPVQTETSQSRRRTVASPGEALWKQRQKIASLQHGFRALSTCVGRPGDLALYQWIQIAAFALEFRPDLVIELGRGYGNSTCCFLEVANQLGGATACRLLSFDLSDDWSRITVPRLKGIVPPNWFAPAEIQNGNILDYDFSSSVDKAKRCFLFWDAHGFDVAEYVLGNLLPRLATRPHVVAIHDLGDPRYEEPPRQYGELGLWKGEDGVASFWLGGVFSSMSEAISLLDFSSRNSLPLHATGESLQSEIARYPESVATFRAMLADDCFSLGAGWFWFTLAEAPGPLTFPRVTHRSDPHALIQQRQAEAAALRASSQQGQAEGKIKDDIGRPPSSVTPVRQEVVQLQLENHELRLALAAVENSAGWQILNNWRRVRDRLAPNGTGRRRLYDSLVRNFRGSQ